MSDRMRQYQRMARIMEKLQQESATNIRVTCESLARDLEVSERTIKRDLDEIRKKFHNIEIGYDHRQQTLYLVDPRTYEKLKLAGHRISVSNHDLFLMLMATHVLSQFQGSPVIAGLEQAIQNLTSSLPDNPAVISINTLLDAFHPLPVPLRPVDPEIFTTVRRAVALHKILRIEYKPPTGRKNTRRIHPSHLVSHLGDLYMIAWCEKRQALRVFALSRIVAVSDTEEYYEPHDHPEIAHYLEHQFGVFLGEKERTYAVRLRFTRDQAPYVRERQWHKHQKISERKDGSLELAFKANHLFEVARWVLSWGAAVKVLSPPELAAQVKAELAGALKQYK